VTSDAFGHMLDAIDKGRTDLVEIVERDDGVFSTGGGLVYIAPFAKWTPVERRAMRFARERVLDLGAGPGRVVIHLQERGFDVVGIERSPLIARIARRRGARNIKVTSVEDVDRRKLGIFDTVVMYGNNLGMLGTIPKTRRLLRRLLDVTSDDARILAGSNDHTEWRSGALYRSYAERNRKRGRPPGTERIRLRYAQHVTPWFEWLFLSPRELEEMVDGTGWHLARLVKEDKPPYVAILEKD
jgi:SAM-dependent methyltransferase